MSSAKPTAGKPNSTSVGAPSVLPVVARPNSGPSTAAIVAGVILAGLLLFALLENRRRALSAPATFPAIAQADLSRSPPPLYIPPVPVDVAPAAPATPVVPVPAPSPYSREFPRQPALLPPPPVTYIAPATPSVIQTLPPRNAGGSAIVIDNSQSRLNPATGDAAASSRVPGVATDRTRSGMLANRGATVPQGTLIQAVLETAFNSTSPGFARALVQRDVRGFDGSRILIPRGSRLIGEYRSDATQGQKRVMIVWARLIRPDGVTIALASPSADTLGRGGVRADVDTHFWERFGGAILQSTLDLGVGLATHNTRSPVIVAGSVSNAAGTAIPQPGNIPPTLKIAAGTSINVFVARDLDFSGEAGDS